MLIFNYILLYYRIGKYFGWSFVYSIEEETLIFSGHLFKKLAPILSILLVLVFFFHIYSRIFGKMFKPNLICSKFLIYAKEELKNGNTDGAIRFILNSIDFFPPIGFYTYPFVLGDEILIKYINPGNIGIYNSLIHEIHPRLEFLKRKLERYVSILVLDPSNENIEHISKKLEEYAEIIRTSKYTKIDGKLELKTYPLQKAINLIFKYFVQIVIALLISIISIIIGYYFEK